MIKSSVFVDIFLSIELLQIILNIFLHKNV